jgi:hypothetical protein
VTSYPLRATIVGRVVGGGCFLVRTSIVRTTIRTFLAIMDDSLRLASSLHRLGPRTTTTRDLLGGRKRIIPSTLGSAVVPGIESRDGHFSRNLADLEEHAGEGKNKTTSQQIIHSCIQNDSSGNKQHRRIIMIIIIIILVILINLHKHGNQSTSQRDWRQVSGPLFLIVPSFHTHDENVSGTKEESSPNQRAIGKLKSFEERR